MRGFKAENYDAPSRMGGKYGTFRGMARSTI